MILRQTHERIYSRRRRHTDWDFGFPLHKRIIRRIERVNKVLWTGLLGALLRVRHATAPLDPKSVRSILFIRNDAIGDMVLTSPLWHELRRQFPNIRIGVVASIRNRMLLDHDPSVDRSFEATAGDPMAFLRTRKEIACEPWDLVMPMNYSNKTRTALLAKFLAPKSIATTLVRPGESREKRAKLFGIVVFSPYRTEDIEMIEQMRIHLEGVLDMKVLEAEWRPRVYPDPEALISVGERIHELLAIEGRKRYFHLNLEARTPFREYGLESSLELSRLLTEEFHDASLLWTTSPQAAPRVIAYLEQHPLPRVHFFRTGSLHELFGVVRGASLVISPDTSVVHIASAFQRPVVALYPLVHEWPPYKTPYRLVLPTRSKPVSSIPAARVVDACKELLTEVVATSAQEIAAAQSGLFTSVESK